jgi:hypothetical protein
MLRRSTPQQTLADRYFPIRLRVAVPTLGFGAQLEHMHAWLDQHAGPDGYFNGSQTQTGMKDAALFYFMDPKVAAEFVETFGCELVVGHEAPSSRDPRASRR